MRAVNRRNIVKGVLLLGWMVLSGAAFADETAGVALGGNPALEKFGADITFYAGFDQTATADLSNGNGSPRESKIALQHKPGKWGQAMLSGLQSVSYDAGKNADLSKPGAMAVWVSAFEWKRNPAAIPNLYFVNILDQGRQIMLSRMGDPRNKEAVFAYAKVAERGLSVKNGSSANWQEGEWHLLVVNWRGTSFEFSLDGRSVRRQEMPTFETATGKQGQIIVGCKGRENQQFLLDELMIFNRPLTQEEVQWLWEQK